MKLVQSLLIVAILFQLVACSKNQRTNRTIEGTWTATTIAGVAASSTLKETLTFAKGKKGEGTGNVSITQGTVTEDGVMRYFIKNSRITLIVDETATVFYDIEALSDSEMTLKDVEGALTVLTK